MKGRLGWKGLTADEYVDEGYGFLSTPDIKAKEIEWEHINHITAERYFESPEIMLERGDVLLTKDGSTLGIVNVVRELPEPSTVNSSIAVLRPSGRVSGVYLRYFLSAHPIQSHIERMKDGMGVPHLFQADIRKFPVLLPSIREQQAICDFLERETEGIDTLVAKAQRLIELLQESRTVLISHAVTKGLDPNAPMKDSGVEWLGQVPVGWQVLSLSRVTTSRCDGPFGSGLKSDNYTDAGRRVIRLQNIASGRFDHRDSAFVDEDYYREHLGEHDVLPGDLLIAGLGDETHPVGRACVAPEGLGDAMVKADCFRFRLDLAKAEPHFLALQLSATAAATSAVLSTGATRTRVNMSTMATRSIVVPPVSEQRAIVSGVETAGMRLESLVGSVAGAMERLREYRSALITAAVTGQIDVRTYRRDPEEALEAS